jgi:hypothetical protein
VHAAGAFCSGLWPAPPEIRGTITSAGGPVACAIFARPLSGGGHVYSGQSAKRCAIFRSRPNLIAEIDGRPALDVWLEWLESSEGSAPLARYLKARSEALVVSSAHHRIETRRRGPRRPPVVISRPIQHDASGVRCEGHRPLVVASK